VGAAFQPIDDDNFSVAYELDEVNGEFDRGNGQDCHPDPEIIASARYILPSNG
jgi:hypothetical protein